MSAPSALSIRFGSILDEKSTTNDVSGIPPPEKKVFGLEV